MLQIVIVNMAQTFNDPCLTTMLSYTVTVGLHQPVGDPETASTAFAAADSTVADGQQPFRGTAAAADDNGGDAYDYVDWEDNIAEGSS